MKKVSAKKTSGTKGVTTKHSEKMAATEAAAGTSAWAVVGDALRAINKAHDELTAHRSDLYTVELAIRGLDDSLSESVAFCAQQLGCRFDATMEEFETASDQVRSKYHETPEHAARRAAVMAYAIGDESALPKGGAT